MVSTLRLPKRRKDEHAADGASISKTLRELREGWQFIAESPRVRAVIVGLATGLIGGGMVVPLGTLVATDVVGAGPQGYGIFVTALGTGVAIGVLGISLLQKRLPVDRVFIWSLFAGGVSLIAGASMWRLEWASVFVTCLGVAAGSVYVLGFTILQTNVSDELRGRIFATLYTLVRFCMLLALTVAPILSQVLDGFSDHWFSSKVLGVSIPGVRLTLWLGGLIIIGAGFLAVRSMRAERRIATT
jgi:dTMP kinase